MCWLYDWIHTVFTCFFDRKNELLEEF
jgi:hypothetical protein